MDHMSHTNENQHYFGVQLVQLRVAEGAAHVFQNEEFIEDASPEAKAVVLQRISPAAFLGDPYAHLVLPAVPAIDFKQKHCKHKDTPAAVASLPAALSAPLIKSNSGTSLISGVQSGRRSALVQAGDKWYRLKGCGNLYEGFNSRDVADHPGLREIRGCQFEHTVSRELCMTELVNRLMAQQNIPSANRPAGWFEYSNTADGVANIYPAVKRCCGVFETAGERRLADHVLSGLESLLPHLIPRAQLPSQAQLAAYFPASRKPGTDDFMQTWVLVVTEEPLSSYTNLASQKLALHVPAEPPLAKTDNPLLLQAWKRAHEHLLQYESTNLLGLAYWRLGREAGNVVRILSSNHISWGTYTDLLGTHCNAHPNNLLVVPSSHSRSHLLAPLDFDMAFTRSGFVGEPSLFDENLRMERQAMCAALAGDHQLNSGVVAVAELPADYQLLKWALRDTIVCGYKSGLENVPDAHPVSANELVVMRALIELALVTTAAHIS